MVARTPKRYKVDNTSPIFQYQSEWSEGARSRDPQVDKYLNSTFTLTQMPGAAMNFRFTGTSITVSGAQRFNHGNYTVMLDGTTSTMDGHAEPSKFQTTLFRADNLKMTSHNLVLLNSPIDDSKKFLDVDYVEWESVVHGSETETLDDADDRFQYEPSNVWYTDPSNHTGYASNTGHFVTSSNAVMRLKFHGDGVELFGSIGPDHGTYSISMDGMVSGPFIAKKKFYFPRQVLFIADNLGAGEHTLELASSSNGVIGIDEAVITKSASSSSSRMSLGAIAGIAVGGAAVLVLFVAGFILGIKESRRRKRDNELLNTAGIPFEGVIPLALPPSYEDTRNASILASYPTKSDQLPGSSNLTESLSSTRSAVMGSSYASFPTKSSLPSSSPGSADTPSNTREIVIASGPVAYPTKSPLPPRSSNQADNTSTLGSIYTPSSLPQVPQRPARNPRLSASATPARELGSATMISADAASVFRLSPVYTQDLEGQGYARR